MPKLVMKFHPPRRSFHFEIQPLVSLLETSRQLTHLSWPLFIPLATTAVRLVATTPLAIYNRKLLNKQQTLAPILSASSPIIKAQLASKVVAGEAVLTPQQINVLALKEKRKRRIALYKEFKCQSYKLLFLPAVQIPLFITMSFAMRALVGYDLTALTEFGNADTSQFLYFRNIVEPDPYKVLPVLLGISSLSNIELNQQLTKQNNLTRIIGNLSYLGSLVFMAISFNAPLGLQLYWVSSNIFSLIQNFLLKPKRKLLYIH